MATKENKHCRKKGVATFIKALEIQLEEREGPLDETLQYMWGVLLLPTSPV